MLDANLCEHCTCERIERSIRSKPGHGKTGGLPGAHLLTLLWTQNLEMLEIKNRRMCSCPKQYIDDDVDYARDVPGDVALQARGKGVPGELSLVMIQRD